MNESFDPKKTVQTRDGRRARILCTDRTYRDRNDYIVALIQDSNGESLYIYQHDGVLPGEFRSSHCDLVNIPTKFIRYMVVFPNKNHHTNKEDYGNTTLFLTEEAARLWIIDRSHHKDCQVAKVEWEE